MHVHNTARSAMFTRLSRVLLLALPLTIASPASAQFFLQPPDYRGTPLVGNEPGYFLPLPNARPEELRAALVWNLRAALNLAALQCQFQESLLTVDQYSTILSDHRVELASAYATLNAYFKRQTKTPKAGLSALDIYGTKTYSSFSAVGGFYGFCQTASHIGRAALFTPKGGLANLASHRLMELRKSLAPGWDQQLRRFRVYNYTPMLPPPAPVCTDKKGRVTPCKK